MVLIAQLMKTNRLKEKRTGVTLYMPNTKRRGAIVVAIAIGPSNVYFDMKQTKIEVDAKHTDRRRSYREREIKEERGGGPKKKLSVQF